MVVGVFREVAHHPAPVGAPAVPSTVLLSDDSPAVLPDATAIELEGWGWDVRRLPGVGHDFWLEDADRTFAAVQDLLVAR
jgi:pimeloyl-ACP methyl ester carboxylesterase